jgi:hypothetical protein
MDIVIRTLDLPYKIDPQELIDGTPRGVIACIYSFRHVHLSLHSDLRSFHHKCVWSLIAFGH